MIAMRRSDVTDLNGRARALMHAAGHLGDSTILVGDREIAVGEHIVTLRNAPGIGILNGTRGIVTAIDTDRRQLTLQVVLGTLDRRAAADSDRGELLAKATPASPASPLAPVLTGKPPFLRLSREHGAGRCFGDDQAIRSVPLLQRIGELSEVVVRVDKLESDHGARRRPDVRGCDVSLALAVAAQLPDRLAYATRHSSYGPRAVPRSGPAGLGERFCVELGDQPSCDSYRRLRNHDDMDASGCERHGGDAPECAAKPLWRDPLKTSDYLMCSAPCALARRSGRGEGGRRYCGAHDDRQDRASERLSAKNSHGGHATP